MKMTLLVLSVFLMMTGHTYGQDLMGVNEKAPHERAPHERAPLERAPHEKAPHEKLLGEYERLMNGESPIEVDLPTESFEDFVAKSKIFDDKRTSGKEVGRAPAVIDVEDIYGKASSR